MCSNRMQMPWELWKRCLWRDHGMLEPRDSLNYKLLELGHIYEVVLAYSSFYRWGKKPRSSITYSKPDRAQNKFFGLLTHSPIFFHYASFPLLLCLHSSDFHSEEFPQIIKIVDWGLIQILPYRLFCTYLTNLPSFQKSELQAICKIYNRLSPNCLSA